MPNDIETLQTLINKKAEANLRKAFQKVCDGAHSEMDVMNFFDNIKIDAVDKDGNKVVRTLRQSLWSSNSNLADAFVKEKLPTEIEKESGRFIDRINDLEQEVNYLTNFADNNNNG